MSSSANAAGDDRFDDSEFLFKLLKDRARSAGLEKRLNEIPNPSGGQGPMKKKKKVETRKPSEVARKDVLIKDAKEKMEALDDPVQPAVNKKIKTVPMISDAA